jgi:hypothetical protein
LDPTLNEKQKEFIESLSSNCGISEEQIIKVFQGYYTLVARGIMEGKQSFSIPYVADFRYDFTIVTENKQFILKEKIHATVDRNLREVMVQTYNKKDDWQEKFFINRFRKVFGRIFSTDQKYEESQEEKLIEKFVYGEG